MDFGDRYPPRFFKFVWKDLQYSDAETNNYINAWIHFYQVKMGYTNDVATHHEAKAALWNHMYDNLTILDGKSGPLLTSSSILTAIISIIHFNVLETLLPDNLDQLATLVLLIVSLFSVYTCIHTFKLRWSMPQEYKEKSLDSLALEL